MIDITLVVARGRLAHIWLRIQRVPSLHPAGHAVLARLDHIDLGCFCQCFFQFGANLSLCFAENAFSNLLSRLWVTTCNVARFPATIFSLSNGAFAIDSLFAICVPPFGSSNEYHKDSEIASPK